MNNTFSASQRRSLVSVIMTHRAGGEIRSALLSLLDQTHENWECIVVDDASSSEDRAGLEAIVAGIASPKIRVVRTPEPVGEIRAFFMALEHSRGGFVCLLDPDDRYADTFLAERLASHFSGPDYGPIPQDQILLAGGGVVTGGDCWHILRASPRLDLRA